MPRAAKKSPAPDPGITYVSWHSFACDLSDGRQVTVGRGQKLRGGDIIVRTNPQFFVPDGSSAEDVEARRRETFPDDHPATWISPWSRSEGSR